MLTIFKLNKALSVDSGDYNYNYYKHSIQDLCRQAKRSLSDQREKGTLEILNKDNEWDHVLASGVLPAALDLTLPHFPQQNPSTYQQP